MKQIVLLIAFFSISWLVGKSQSIPAPTSASARLAGFEQRKELKNNSWFNHLPFTNIGPTVCSGRVVDVDVNPGNPNEMYVAYASGGVWHTNNNATTFTPIFDQEACMTIGDIAVNWNTGVIWVGTGENNSSRSSYSGVGIYKSSDKGKTWKNMGLPESHHIGRILLHPINPNIIHVACLGALYSANANRGVYSTSDGGVTWRQSLFINDGTGAIDLVADPSNPNILYAATWERSRRAWNFVESGPGSAIYISADSGRNWKILTTEGSGFPTGQGTGRIGLEIVRSKNETILYAIIDNQHDRPTEPRTDTMLTKADLVNMSSDSFLKLSDKKINHYLEENGFPEKYTTDTIRLLIKKGTIKPSTLVEYLQNANSKLFDTKVAGTEIYQSTDQGKTWTKAHEGYLDNIFYTYGYYFGQIRASKLNTRKLYILGVPILKSEDGGATWKSIDGDNVHGDHHALWVNPKRDGHLISGNDGGLNISYDDGKSWIKCNHPSVGQFYSVNVDNAKSFNVYGGLQDNGVWTGPSNYQQSTGWHGSGQYPYKEIMGGDGMQVAIDTRDNNTLYTGYQFGNYYRTSRDGSLQDLRITPQHELGERPYRWNWETPIHLSTHQQDILYMGAEKVFRSFDQGTTFKAISGDLTKGEKEGDIAYGTLVSLHESPRILGLIYAGSDDGLIHMTRDGGQQWTRISDALPQDLWVSSLQASKHSDGRVYASLNGYRWDHFDSYVFSSEDYGKTWNRLGLNLPTEPVNVFKEDPTNEDILYAGTDNGLYISLDRGNSFMAIGDMPATPVHDLVIQPRDKMLVVATHGRSLYKADVSHVEQLNSNKTDSLTCFAAKLTTYHSERWGTRSANWMEFNEPKITFPVFTPHAGNAKLEIFADSLLVMDKEIKLEKGLSYYTYNLDIKESSVDPLMNALTPKQKETITRPIKKENGIFYLPPGKYKLKVIQDTQEAVATLEIKSRN